MPAGINAVAELGKIRVNVAMSNRATLSKTALTSSIGTLSQVTDTGRKDSSSKQEQGETFGQTAAAAWLFGPITNGVISSRIDI